jgi:hypothetical protein
MNKVKNTSKMKTYQIYVDVPRNGNWEEEIDVESMEILAHNANDAFIQANREIQHEEFYVWEVSEDDII